MVAVSFLLLVTATGIVVGAAADDERCPTTAPIISRTTDLDYVFEYVIIDHSSDDDDDGEFRSRLSAAYDARRRRSPPESPLRRVSLRNILTGCAPSHFGSCWPRPKQASRPVDVVRCLLASEALDDWRLAAVLVWAATQSGTACADSFGALVLPSLLRRTIADPAFFPLLYRLLQSRPDACLPPSDVVQRFYADQVRASMPHALAHAVDVPFPGSRVQLPATVADLWRELLRCGAPSDVHGVVVLAQGDLAPPTWSVLFFEAVARICAGPTRLHVIVAEARFQKHLFAEAVVRAYRPDHSLFLCVRHWMRFRCLIDPSALATIDAELLIEWIDRFFRESAPDKPQTNAAKLDALQRLLSHLSVADLELFVVDLLRHDARLLHDTDKAYQTLVASSSSSSDSIRRLEADRDYRIQRLGDAKFLDLAGSLHFLLLSRTDLHRLYEEQVQSTVQSYRIVLAIAFWQSSSNKYEPNSYLSDAFLSQCVWQLSDQAHAGAGIFADDQSGRPEFVADMIAKGSSHLTDLDRYQEATRVRFHSARYPRQRQAIGSSMPELDSAAVSRSCRFVAPLSPIDS